MQQPENIKLISVTLLVSQLLINDKSNLLHNENKKLIFVTLLVFISLNVYKESNKVHPKNAELILEIFFKSKLSLFITDNRDEQL